MGTVSISGKGFHWDMTDELGVVSAVTEGDITAARIGARVRRDPRGRRAWTVTEFALRVGCARRRDGRRGRAAAPDDRDPVPAGAGALRWLRASCCRRRSSGRGWTSTCRSSTAPDSSTAQVIGGGPGNPTQTYLFDMRAGEGDGGFGKPPRRGAARRGRGRGRRAPMLGRPDVTVARRPVARHRDARAARRPRVGPGPARFLLVCTDACPADRQPRVSRRNPLSSATPWASWGSASGERGGVHEVGGPLRP